MRLIKIMATIDNEYGIKGFRRLLHMKTEIL